MGVTQLYDGRISGSQIVTAIGSVSAANLVIIPHAAGQRVVILQVGQG